jgi:sodium transport system permease protein
MALDLREVWTISSNELRCLLRDRHTLVYSVLMPFLLYPALFIGVTQAVTIARGASERRISHVGIDGPAAPEVTAFLAGRDKFLIAPLPPDWPESFDPAKEWIREGKLDAVVRTATDEGGSLAARVLFSDASDGSRSTRERLESALSDLRREKLRERAESLGGGEGLLDVLEIHEQDISPPAKRAWEALARVMPLFLVLMITLGALYPALDATVGERERGTIETTLLEPVDWTALILGKYLPVTALSMLSAALNFTSMGISMWVFFLQAKVDLGSLAIPLDSLLWSSAAAVLIALLIGAVMMSVALFARSFKEGQSYLGAILIAAMIPGFASAIPEVQLGPATVVVPVLNLGLLCRESLRGRLDPAMGLLVLLAAVFHTALALIIASRLIRRETVLLGAPAARPARRGFLGLFPARR